MELRALGRSGLMVSPLCFGGNVFGWTADKRRTFELLDAFAAAGFNFIDTADTYSRWVPASSSGCAGPAGLGGAVRGAGAGRLTSTAIGLPPG
jgi:aryl-alcohol dehydrogenase-like predicted oxidoreductase